MDKKFVRPHYLSDCVPFTHTGNFPKVATNEWTHEESECEIADCYDANNPDVALAVDYDYIDDMTEEKWEDIISGYMDKHPPNYTSNYVRIYKFAFFLKNELDLSKYQCHAFLSMLFICVIDGLSLSISHLWKHLDYFGPPCITVNFIDKILHSPAFRGACSRNKANTLIKEAKGTYILRLYILGGIILSINTGKSVKHIKIKFTIREIITSDGCAFRNFASLYKHYGCKQYYRATEDSMQRLTDWQNFMYNGYEIMEYYYNVDMDIVNNIHMSEIYTQLSRVKEYYMPKFRYGSRAHMIELCMVDKNKIQLYRWPELDKLKELIIKNG